MDILACPILQFALSVSGSPCSKIKEQLLSREQPRPFCLLCSSPQPSRLKTQAPACLKDLGFVLGQAPCVGFIPLISGVQKTS